MGERRGETGLGGERQRQKEKAANEDTHVGSNEQTNKRGRGGESASEWPRWGRRGRWSQGCRDPGEFGERWREGDPGGALGVRVARRGGPCGI